MKDFVATTLYGMEEVLADELTSLGADAVRAHNRAVSFAGDKKMLYRANYHLRTALRVLKPLRAFPARNEDDIYKGIRDIAWEGVMGPKSTLAVESVLVSDRYKHSGYISQKVKDGIVDRFRDRTGSRPSVDLKDPDVRIHIHLGDTHCNVSLDGSGESLHKRGYRTLGYKAPLNEVLAAGLIKLSGWEPGMQFVNPMCGSGTLAIEAGNLARGLPGGYFRTGFGFQAWNDYEPELFESVRKERFLKDYKDQEILACDLAFPAIRAAQQNLARAGLLGKVGLVKSGFESWQIAKETGSEGMIIMNPPYGERMEEDDLQALYKNIGDTLKKNFSGYQAWIFSGNPDAMKHVGLRTSHKLTLFNGPIKCKYHQYELYGGSRKKIHRDNPV
jgi:putative N6-adenine-specific DNA methylase